MNAITREQFEKDPKRAMEELTSLVKEMIGFVKETGDEEVEQSLLELIEVFKSLLNGHSNNQDVLIEELKKQMDLNMTVEEIKDLLLSQQGTKAP